MAEPAADLNKAFAALRVEWAQLQTAHKAVAMRMSQIVSLVRELPSMQQKERPREEPLAERQVVDARTLGYAGDACPECGMFRLRRKGTCLSCDTCGWDTGCG